MGIEKGHRPAVGVERLEPRAYLAAGDLDAFFGNGGRVLPGSNQDSAQEVVVQSDGKLVVAGRSSSVSEDGVAVARYLADGSLDPIFGTAGRALLTDLGGHVAGMTILPGGKILIAAGGETLDFALTRLNANGSLDTSFGGGDSIVHTDFAGETDNPYALAVRPDGRILVGGYTFGNHADFAIAQYTSDGALDPSFGNGGKAVFAITKGRDEIAALAVQGDGKILAAGITAGMRPGVGDWSIARISANGKSLDRSFGTRGLATTEVGGAAGARAIRVMRDGKILVAGAGGRDFTVVRYTPAGAPDPTFGRVGIAKVDFGAPDAFANDLVIQKGGGIVLAGSAGGTSSSDGKPWMNFAAARLTVDGRLDPTFGRRGKIAVGFFPDADVAQSAALLPKGKIVLVGRRESRGVQPPNPMDFQIARLTAAGQVDSAFGDAGLVTTDFTSPARTRAVDVVHLAGGELLVLHEHEEPFHTRFGVSRYDLSGALDITFGQGGTTLIDFGGTQDQPTAMALQPGGRIAVTGWTAGGSFPITAAAVALLNPDGSLATEFGGDGITTQTGGPNTSYAARTVAFQGDKILVAGQSSTGAFLMLRFNPDGSLDATFGDGGNVETPFDPNPQFTSFTTAAHDMTIQDDGKIVLAGHHGRYVDWGMSPGNVFAVARNSANGQLDPTFGEGGRVMQSFSAAPENDIARSVAIDAAGNIVLAGLAHANRSGNSPFTGAFAAIRLRPDGSLDPTFGDGGKVTIPFGEFRADANDVAIQADGKILLAGEITTNDPTSGYPNIDFALARLNVNGSLDASFGETGKITTHFGQADSASAMTLLAGGQIVVAGTSDHQLALARYQNDQQQIRAEVIDGTLVISGTPQDGEGSKP
jgi:uncharacterized delta-60 repeat protein